MKYFDADEIRKAISVIHGANKLFEVRIISGNSNTPVSGYFMDAETMIRELSKQDLSGRNVYLIPNTINDACYSRTQKDCFKGGKIQTTSDKDIVVKNWMLIDLDPERPSGTSATTEQVKYAGEKAKGVIDFLSENGFEKPVIALSGNGYHLLYRVNFMQSTDNKNVVTKFLKSLDILFSDENVKIDTQTGNESRGCKLYGTLAQKGLNTDERPHRMSKILKVPDEIKVTDKSYINKIANWFSAEQMYRGQQTFDLEDWLYQNAIEYKPYSYGQGMKYVLKNCPFDENHKSPDSAIFKFNGGGIGFKCLHNSCSDYTWKDVRMLYEPNAYDRKPQTTYERKTIKKPEVKTIPKPQTSPAFLTAKDIRSMPKPKDEFIKTGIAVLDKKLRGLKKKNVSVWTGLRGSAKSTTLTNISLNIIDRGARVVMYSGELTESNALQWMLQQAAGKRNVEPDKEEGFYNPPLVVQDQITDWLGDNFLLYNNKFGNNFLQFKGILEKEIEKRKADLIILDNLMSLNIKDFGDNKYDAQTEFVLELCEMSKIYNIHIAFVAHPRKASGFLRFNDISGTADLGNAVDSAFIVHRTNRDFQKLFTMEYSKRELEAFGDATNIVEIVKDRNGGVQDVFIPLWYEVESRRLRNRKDEAITYGWEKSFNRDDNPFT